MMSSFRFVTHFFLLLLVGLWQNLAAEGTKELNTNNAESTKLYLCNDFTNHCSGSNGVRSQFATYDNTQSAADPDRLYFVVQNTDELVYLGFQGGSLNNPNNPARHIVYRIKNLAGTIIQAEQNLPTSGTGYINDFTEAINGPDQLIPAPLPANGYTALVFDPPAIGTYYIEFTVRRNDNNNIYTGTFTMDLFDITVANSLTLTAKPGRVYSKSWQFSEDNDFYGKNYFISDDSIVTSAQFTGMQGGSWIQYCNQTGCGSSAANWITNRKSLYQQQALYPQYKIFLNNPDPVLFPAATTLGQIVAPQPYGVQNCLTGHIIFHVFVNKPGNAEITLTFPSPYQSRVLNQAVTVGENLFDWDGLDGTTPTGVPVPNNIPVQFVIKYINGLTNLPLYDVEGNTNGFTIALVNPAGSTPAVYWDDTNIPGGTNNSSPPGCTSPPGCHTWSGATGSGWGNLHTVNTWWYNVSTSTAPMVINEFRGPQTLVFNQSPPLVFCANTSGHVFSVTPDPNTDVYHFSYSPPTGVTIVQATPGSYSVSINFGAGAASGTLQVYGSNTNCAVNGPVSSLPITINPVPVPTLNGPTSACAGQTNQTYTTESGKSNYQWTVSSGGTITAGGTSTSNTVTVTWNTTGTKIVSVNYQSGTPPCTAATPTQLQVTVNPLPVPSLSGLMLVCVGSTGITYTTQPNQLNYVWTVSSGGTITGGGTSTSNSVTVTWNTIGLQTVTVSYTDPVTTCTAAVPTALTVNVNSLPVPTFTSGPTDVCIGVAGNVYTTQPNMSNYVWNVTGGMVTSGGNATSNTAVILWNSVGLQSVSVNYTIPFSSCTALNPTVYIVNVHPLPVPAITSGNNSVCAGIPGNVYLTDPGKLNYQWNVTGGIITGGGGTGHDYATVTWFVPGNQQVTVNYTEPGTLCTATVPATFPVTVKPLPQPLFLGGDNEACFNSSGHVYSTQSGMSNYIWNITGGTITSGGGPDDPTATVLWSQTGIQEITVNFTDPVTQCTAASPAIFQVLVKPLPQPSFISGDPVVCRLTQGHLYATQPAMTGYIWQVTGGTITSGGGLADAGTTVTWNSSGLQQISVSYTDPATQCAAASPASYDVTVNPLPLPVITGPSAACLNAPGPQYVTEPGMTDYTWTVTGGSVIGTNTNDTVNIVWNTTGQQTLSLSYQDPNGCYPEFPAEKSVTVNTLPTPGITGPATVCSQTGQTYSTEQGMQSYSWTITGPYTLVAGGTAGDSFATVKWLDPGTQNVSVNYLLGTGCTAPTPTSFPVLINPTPVASVMEQPPALNCVTFNTSFTTESGMSDYLWAVSSGGAIFQGINSSQTDILWNATGAQWVNVSYTNSFGCRTLTPTKLDVTINSLPLTSITPASGPDCDDKLHGYSVPSDPVCTYAWSVQPPAFGQIASGQGSNAIAVLWNLPGSSMINLLATNNINGCYASSAINRTVYPSPEPTLAACFDTYTIPGGNRIILHGAAPFLSGQGTYSGQYVALNTGTGYFEFDPSIASTGNYAVGYEYTNIYGCTSTAGPVIIQVVPRNFTCGTDFSDPRDGQVYTTALIGGKCWMTRNLNYGQELGWLQPPTDNCVDEKTCHPADQGCTLYGGFYAWNELMRYDRTYMNQGLCPSGWRIPSAQEWDAMLYSLATGVNPPDGIAGSFLKDLNLNSGLHLLMPGLFYLVHSWQYTTGDLTGGMYWTSTIDGSDRAVARGVNSLNPSNSKYSGNRENSFLVRCVKQ